MVSNAAEKTFSVNSVPVLEHGGFLRDEYLHPYIPVLNKGGFAGCGVKEGNHLGKGVCEMV